MGTRGETSNWMANVDVFVDPDRSETKQAASLEAISKLLVDKKITIQDVVTAVGKYLTTTDNSLRARGLILLGELLVKLAKTPLMNTAVHSLAAFFTARLEDWHCLRGALIGSTALLTRSQQLGKVEESDVKDMAKAVLQHLHVQALGLTDRLMSLELFECLLSFHAASVSSLGRDLVYGVCEAIEAEKDPRCLLVAFNLVMHLAHLFPAPDGPLAGGAQDLFDVVSCYFPVSFTPPPNDTRGISRDDLADALLMVFTSTPLFAPYCIPKLLEKLSSSLPSAKMDSLKYLGVCALSYGPKSMSEHVEVIWPALKDELIPKADDAQKDVQTRDAALLCLTRCVEAFQRGVDEGGDVEIIEADLLKLICEDDCVEDLLRFVENDLNRESQHKSISGGSILDNQTMFEPEDYTLSKRANDQTRDTGEILAAVVKASPSSCYIVTDKILNRIILAGGLSSGQVETLRKGSLSILGLNVTIQILEAAAEVAKTTALARISSSTSGPTKPITKKWLEPIRSVAPKLLMAFSEVTLGQIPTQNPSKLGVAGLQALASFPAGYSPLTEEELQHLLSVLVETLLADTNPSDLKDTALKAILTRSNLEEKFRRLNEEEDTTVVTVVFPKLLEAVQKAQTSAALKFPLQALAAVAGTRQTARQAALSGLRQIRAAKFTELGAADDNASQGMVSILECLSQEIIPLCEKGSTDQITACDIVLDIWSACQSLSHTTHQISDEVLSSLMAVNRVTIRACTEGAQEKILSKATTVLLDWGITNTSVDTSMKQNAVMHDCTTYTTTKFIEERGWLVALVASIVLGLCPLVVFPKRHLLLKTFVKMSISEASFLKTKVAAQATASLINKWKDTLSGDRRPEGKIDTLDEAIRAVVDETFMPVINQHMGDHDSSATTVVDDSVHEECDKNKMVRAVHALAWIGKGLAMRGHARISDIAGTLMALLESEGLKAAPVLDALVDQVDSRNLSSVVALAQAAAEGIGIIVKEDATCLDRVHNATVRPLFKQRFFTSMLPPLQEAVRRAGNSSYRIWFYRAFGHLLVGIPRNAVLTEGQKVFPLVLEGLSALSSHPEDSPLLLSTLLTLSSFLTDENSGRNIAAEYVPAMVRRLTTLVHYRSSLVIRETALQCLGAIVGLPFTRVYPEKPQVMKAINAALDDHKRRVRKEAVSCRRVWSAISS
ncbi:unnamed protein product [Calypogeia fissa]